MSGDGGGLREVDCWGAAPTDLSVCNGCDDCGDRCLDGWECTREEFEALLGFAERCPDARAACRQPKEVLWGEGTLRLCWFRDREGRRCSAYPVRPLVCRLFGHVDWLPCPTGRVIPLPGSGVAEAQAYANAPRRTFVGWACEGGLVERSRGALGDPVVARLLATR